MATFGSMVGWHVHIVWHGSLRTDHSRKENSQTIDVTIVDAFDRTTFIRGRPRRMFVIRKRLVEETILAARRTVFPV